MSDLLSTIELTGSSAIVFATLTLLFARAPVERILVLLGLVLWFSVVVTLGATGALQPEAGIGTPGLGLAVLLPLVILTLLGFGTRIGRARLEHTTLPVLTGLHAIRVLGISFVLLYQAHRLPAPFAPVAGWGDFAIGLAALPMAFWAARGGAGARTGLMVWNMLGLADLVAAIGLGATSAPGPIRLFFAEPGSAIMTSLPWILIPCFIVPTLAFTHLVSFSRLRQAARVEAHDLLVPEIGG